MIEPPGYTDSDGRRLVIRCEGVDNLWMVASKKTAPGTYWPVRFDRGVAICPCPAGVENDDRKMCRHGRLAALYEQAKDKLNHPPRPTAPANVSALVD